MARTLAGQSLVLRSVCLAIVGAAFFPAPARALTPESPEVKASVARACAYLAASTSTEGRHGGKALVGLVFLKAEQPNHARVQEAVAAVYDALKGDNPGNVEYVYATGLMLIFLTELPPEQHVQHAEAISTLVGRLKAVQKAHGGWGYISQPTGDTSMTQYGILGYWSAEAAGFETPLDSWEKGANWLMRTQDPDGAHGYQGNDPGGFIPIAQSTTTESICAAGAGSLYMCADYFGLLDEKLGKGAAVDEADNPLKRVKKPGVGRKGKETTLVDPSILWQRMEKANGHMDAVFTVDPPGHPYYYLYAYERYRTFRDYVDGNIEKEMPWYTDAAKSLFTLQEADGHWQTRNQEGNVCDTCFATLFLLRSMYKKVMQIKRLQGGLAVGGRGLPSGDGDLEMSKGSVKHKPLKGPFEELLAKMANPNDPDFERALSGLASQSLASDEDHLSDIQKKLRAMFKESKTPEQRVAAIKLLARTRNLLQVPVLLEALKDPEPDVFMAANEGLRFISRKFAGPGFWGGDDETIRREAQKFWNKWYKSLNPEVELE